ncbi:hypothetical protein CMU39_09315 [Elizabethkingia anophelis]|nr:hypothetical protein [Elizabethkingia anophelis]
MNAFSEVNIEDIEVCPDVVVGGGTTARLFYAPVDYFFDLPLPQSSDSYSSEITIPSEVILNKGKKLRFIDILIDENELKQNLSGGAGRKKSRTQLNVFVLGVSAQILGFIKRCANVPLVLFIQDVNGYTWQIGHKRNRAGIETADVTSGKLFEDNSGAVITISCNSGLLLYPFSAMSIAVPGDFNKDFSNDFLVLNYE